MNIPNEIKARFVKDFDIPMQVVKDPYFDYYVELFDSQFRTKAKLALLLDALKQFGSPENFFKASKEFTEGIIEYIKAKQSYADFTQMDMERFKAKVPMRKGELYQEDNAGHQFISFDLRQANFNSMRFVNPDIFDGHIGHNGFIDFARKFTNSDYLLSSKKLRQVIFGNLCPTRQQTVQKYLVSILYECLLNSGFGEGDEGDIKTSNSDEIVLLCDTTLEAALDFIFKIKNLLIFDACKLFSTEIFKLRRLGTDKYDFFVKENLETDALEIKGVPCAYMPEVVKFLKFGVMYEQELTDADRLFYQDGRLCSFKEPLF